jgi:hypothetical protein
MRFEMEEEQVNGEKKKVNISKPTSIDLYFILK